MNIEQELTFLSDCRAAENVKIYCRDGVISTHKLLVASNSDFLKSLLKDQSDCDEVTIFLPDFFSLFVRKSLCGLKCDKEFDSILKLSKVESDFNIIEPKVKLETDAWVDGDDLGFSCDLDTLKYESPASYKNVDKKSFSSSKSSSKVDEKKMLRCYPSGTSKEEKRKHRSEVMKLYVQASEDMKKYDLIFSVSKH